MFTASDQEVECLKPFVLKCFWNPPLNQGVKCTLNQEGMGWRLKLRQKKLKTRFEDGIGSGWVSPQGHLITRTKIGQSQRGEAKRIEEQNVLKSKTLLGAIPWKHLWGPSESCFSAGHLGKIVGISQGLNKGVGMAGRQNVSSWGGGLETVFRGLEPQHPAIFPRAALEEIPPGNLVAQCSATLATVAATPPCSATPFQTQISLRHFPAQGGGGATPKSLGGVARHRCYTCKTL